MTILKNVGLVSLWVFIRLATPADYCCGSSTSKYCCTDSYDRYIYSYSASYQCSTPTRGEFCCAYYTSSGKYKSAFYCEKYCCGSSTSKYCCLTSRYRYLYSYSYNSSCPAPIKGEYCCAYYNSYGTYRSSFFCTKYCCGTPTSKYCCTSSYSRYSPSYSSASLCIPPKSMDEEHEGEWGDISMVFILAPFMFISGVVFIVIRKVCRRTPPGVIHGHQRQPTHSMQTRQTMVSSTPTTSYGPGVHPPTSGAPPSNFGYSPGAPPPTTGYSPGAPPPTTGYSPGAPPPTTGYNVANLPPNLGHHHGVPPPTSPYSPTAPPPDSGLDPGVAPPPYELFAPPPGSTFASQNTTHPRDPKPSTQEKC
ncbi:protein shisa-2 homolog [Lingula anatina]|uniref:Protein shisa-2 homolog n=1 Tax=Lingula anatina TaxID=7574 RepID=A0A1S3HA33_LINAN|nr:protein shisa-2 homolog [Lingula anatina]|eukprot:XP_013382955.1 protein shisa-2 homolog [Lingula anatina]